MGADTSHEYKILIFYKNGGQILYARGADTLRQGGRYFTPRGQILYKNDLQTPYLSASQKSVLLVLLVLLACPHPL